MRAITGCCQRIDNNIEYAILFTVTPQYDTNNINEEGKIKAKSVEYVAELLPDGHLSIPDEIRKKLHRISKKKIKVSIEVQSNTGVKKKHPAFGIWADRMSEGSSVDMAQDLRKIIERRADGSR